MSSLIIIVLIFVALFVLMTVSSRETYWTPWLEDGRVLTDSPVYGLTGVDPQRINSVLYSVMDKYDDNTNGPL